MTDIHLRPSVNPDGYEVGSRHNSNEQDLNRAFPGWANLGMPRNEQMMVKAIINWILGNPFVLSISFHDGQVLINYPWDDSPSAVEGEKDVCPDDDVFSELSTIYADNRPFMWTGNVS